MKLEALTLTLTLALTACGAIKLDSSSFQVDYTDTFAGSEFSASGREPLKGGSVQMPGASSLFGAAFPPMTGC